MNTKAFLDLFFGGKDGFIEFRLIDSKSKPPRATQEFIPIPELLKNLDAILEKLQKANQAGANVYFGALPRTREAGDASAVAEAGVLWCDIDSQDSRVNEDCRRLTAANLSPSVTLNSGHGWHLWWLLKEPIPHARATAIMDQIARVVGGDNVSDPPRIMRLPGFNNVKKDPVPCRIVRWEPTRVYNTSDFDCLSEMPPSSDTTTPVRAATPAQPAKTPKMKGLDSFLDPVAKILMPYWSGNGHRHKLALGIAGLLRKADVDQETVRKIVRITATGAGDEEIDDRLRAVADTFTSADPAGSTVIEEIFGEKAKGFFSDFNRAVAIIPPAPVLRSRFPDFDITACVPPDSPIMQYVEWAYEQTDAPVIFHVASYIALCGAVMGNKVSLPFAGARMLYPNLYTLITAPSSRYRKSTCLGMVRKISTAIKAPVYPNNCTLEALFAVMATEECEWREEPGRKGAPAKQVPVAWRGSPFGMIYHPEFAQFLDVTSKSYMADIRSLLTDLYDGQVDHATGSRQTKTAGKYYISNPAISLLCASTPASIREFVKLSGWQNGFLTRFLLIAPHPSHVTRNEWVEGGEDLRSADAFVKICDRMTALMMIAGVAGITKEAKKVFETVNSVIDRKILECEGTPQAGMDALLARLPQMACKVAMIHAAQRQAPYLEISGEDAQYAVNYVRYSAETLPHLYEHVEPQDNRDMGYKTRCLEILRGMVKRAGDPTVARRRWLQNSNLTANQFDAAVASLLAEGRIIESPLKGRRGGAHFILNENDAVVLQQENDQKTT